MIRTEAVPTCALCGARGRERYRDLRDHLFGAPGSWRLVECEHCRLLWLDPRPIVQDIGAVYATYYTHAPATRSGEVFERHFVGLMARVRAAVVGRWQDARAGIVRRRLGYGSAEGGALAGVLGVVPLLRDSVTLGYADLPDARRGRLLDVGCGNGEFLVRMRAIGWDVRGVEPDPTAAEYARSCHGLEVRTGVVEEAGFESGSFDAIVLSHVIEHVFDPVGLLRACGCLLAPGGTLVVLTPNARSLGHRLLRRYWRGLEPPRHLQVFDVRTLPLCARRAGLTVTSLRTSARLMSSMWYAARGTRQAERFGVPSPSRADYILSFVMAGVEDAGRLAVPSAGEEIIMAATVAVPSPGVTRG